MGIFPILMNIVQFWLIDSIVKASSMAVVALDIEQRTHDSEPLFQGEVEDDYHPSQPSRRSSSLSTSRRLDTPDDHSFDTSLPGILITKECTNHVDSHSYPPSLSGSISSNMAPSHNPKMPQTLAKQTKRIASRSLPRISHHSDSNSLPRTPPPATHAPAVAESADWAESWDDAEEWEQKSNSLGAGDWNRKLPRIQAD